MDAPGKIERLRSQISSLETILSDLRKQLVETENQISLQSDGTSANKKRYSSQTPLNEISSPSQDTESSKWSLHLDDYKRYGRQMILPKIGLDGQLKLRDARVLVVGLGGLGCPAAMYLAGAGIGTIGLMDGDTVELSNLHRQILHTTDSIGMNKAASAREGLRVRYPSVKYQVHRYHLSPDYLKVVDSEYDILLDCTDHPATRYMISDLAVTLYKPLISASALMTEGQLLVLNHPPGSYSDDGFCYRCVFPRPPPPESIISCGEGGILGPVVGVMGLLMATEAIKIVTSEKPKKLEEPARRMLLYSAYSDPPFRTIKLKGKRDGCEGCSSRHRKQPHELNKMDYAAFCGVRQNGNAPVTNRALPYVYLQARKEPHNLLDVRNQTEFGICHFPNAKNIPLARIQKDPDILQEFISNSSLDEKPLFFVCRYGNDSQEAVKIARRLRKSIGSIDDEHIMDIKGGLKAWKDEVDLGFPEY